MIFGFWKRWRERQALIDSDAAALIQDHGESAYHVARDRAASVKRGGIMDGNRSPRHWDFVRREVARRTKRNRTDTATRYTEDQ